MVIHRDLKKKHCNHQIRGCTATCNSSKTHWTLALGHGDGIIFFRIGIDSQQKHKLSDNVS